MSNIYTDMNCKISFKTYKRWLFEWSIQRDLLLNHQVKGSSLTYTIWYILELKFPRNLISTLYILFSNGYVVTPALGYLSVFRMGSPSQRKDGGSVPSMWKFLSVKRQPIISFQTVPVRDLKFAITEYNVCTKNLSMIKAQVLSISTCPICHYLFGHKGCQIVREAPDVEKAFMQLNREHYFDSLISVFHRNCINLKIEESVILFSSKLSPSD